MIDNSDAELEQMKTGISLIEFLAHRNYEILPSKSWANGKVMVCGDDKITVGRGADGRWLWIGRAGAGSIFDLLKAYDGLSLGKSRVELRPWLTGSVTGPSHAREASLSVKMTHRDLLGVEAAYEAMTPIDNGIHPYLNQDRGLTPSLLSLSFLRGKLRRDDTKGFGNAVFPHFNRAGLSGYVACNKDGFKSFAAGGQKGLFGSNPLPDDNRLIIAESEIDGLSYLQMHGADNARIIAFSGTMNQQQPELIRLAIKKLPAGEVIAAVDQDAGGDKFASELQVIFQQAERGDLKYRRHSPTARGMDWNDELRQSQNRQHRPSRGS